jgi:hypothetical protein
MFAGVAGQPAGRRAVAKNQKNAMKLKKILWAVGIGLVLLGVITLLVVALFLDGLVRTGVETVGPKIAGVPVTLESIHIGVLSGSVRVKDLVVGNPEGCKTPFAGRVGLAEVSASVASAMSDKIVIHSIHVVSPEINLEGGLRANNLFKIRDNLGSAASAGEATGVKPPATTGGGPAKKIEVDDFLITGAKIHVHLSGLGGQTLTLPLPDIHLTDLGAGEAGLTPAELTRRIFAAITAGTLKAVTTELGDLGKNVEKLGKGAAGKITSGLGGLFRQ